MDFCIFAGVGQVREPIDLAIGTEKIFWATSDIKKIYEIVWFPIDTILVFPLFRYVPSILEILIENNTI